MAIMLQAVQGIKPLSSEKLVRIDLSCGGTNPLVVVLYLYIGAYSVTIKCLESVNKQICFGLASSPKFTDQ